MCDNKQLIKLVGLYVQVVINCPHEVEYMCYIDLITLELPSLRLGT